MCGVPTPINLILILWMIHIYFENEEEKGKTMQDHVHMFTVKQQVK